MANIIFDNVTVQYPIYNAKSMSIRSKLMSISTGGYLSTSSNDLVTVTALRNANFEFKDGDAIGLIGHNGAGKTTLLRCMAGIYSPISGSIITEGRIATIIELGSGLDLELSGYENIFRMGMLLGATRHELECAVPDIESFTELGDFLSVPVSTYSSGMLMRLMFAVATAVKPEILLVDEMFGTGDSSFQKKAEERMLSLIQASKIFVFASHSTDLIRKYCNRIFRLEHGVMKEIKF